MDEAVSGGKPPAGYGIWIVCYADMARTFELVLHFVKRNTVAVSPNLIMIIIITHLPRCNTNSLSEKSSMKQLCVFKCFTKVSLN